MSDQGVPVYPLRRTLIALRHLDPRRWVAVLLPVFLFGCTQPEMSRPPPTDHPSQAEISGVPLIKQDDFYCGPASLAMVFQWAGSDVSQAEIATRAFTPGAQGTYLADMTGTARRYGMLATRLSTFDDLIDEVAAGHPVIVFQNLGLNWIPRWHYAVVVGYDLNDDRVFLHSGEHEQMVMDRQLFLRTWRRGDHWAIAVLPPDQLPASGNQAEILRAAAALEQVGQYNAAAKVYANGASRWPDNWIWPFGLGNTRYQQGDLDAARRAFERARGIAPDAPEIQNNLNQVLAEMS